VQLSFDFKALGMSRNPVPVFCTESSSSFHYTKKVLVDESLANILRDPNLGLTATARIILLHLAQQPAGSRIEAIAAATGCKYRWIENQVSRLTRLNILRRVSPGTYEINTDREVQE
jgi:hypothetical protein